jgi:hypothetical protein
LVTGQVVARKHGHLERCSGLVDDDADSVGALVRVTFGGQVKPVQVCDHMS